MTTPRPRLTAEPRDQHLRHLDRDAALAAGLNPVEAELVERCYRTGARIADARRWYSWSGRLGAIHFLLLGAIGLPLVALVVLTRIDLDAASALAGVFWWVSIGLALAWLANLIAHVLTPNVLRITERATRTWEEGYWSRAIRAVTEVDAVAGPEAAAAFDSALVVLHPDAVRLAEGDALWLKLNGPASADPSLVGLRGRVEQQVQAIITEAIRLISDRPAALEARPLEWHAASEDLGNPAPRLVNEDDLR